MDLTAIESAENKYLQILEDFFVSVYKEATLPSHGISHHRRVWHFAKELSLIVVCKSHVTDPSFHDSLIIACYLHDAGMSADQGPRHGKMSAEICRDFLRKNALKENDFPGLIQAILNHDNKDYPQTKGKHGLTTILAIADDLDAFGFTGIYRYIEIYTLRGIPAVELGKRIRENAFSRFSHFERMCGIEGEIAKKHRNRYELLDSFFRNYEEQTAPNRSCRNNGCTRVVEILIRMIKERVDLFDIINIHSGENDQVVSWYFKGLKDEAYPGYDKIEPVLPLL